MRTLGGWSRLWIIVTAVYGCIVAIVASESWPRIEKIDHRAHFIEGMSPEAQSVLRTSAKLSQTQDALNAAIDARNLDNARELSLRVARMRIEAGWKGQPISLYMPNGHRFTVPGDTTEQQSQLLRSEYVRVLADRVQERRVTLIGGAVLWWLVPAVLLAGLGAAVGWIIRGFRASGSD
jgi:hypothetical protein